MPRRAVPARDATRGSAARLGEQARNRNPNLSRDDFLDIKRRALHDRMRRRRRSRTSAARGGGRTRVRLLG